MKKRFVVHALDNRDWSPRFSQRWLSVNDWTALDIELVQKDYYWFEPPFNVVYEGVTLAGFRIFNPAGNNAFVVEKKCKCPDLLFIKKKN